ncbi:MAG: hypothetical protein A2075_06250 [Geobacteraceae bacterium GWC2_58_44]|nr:MAG: hypothetical protein A2075_06250 [Geobacteraceae bacterium GWC2_58_44]HBG05765.1 hypothetical protein [Geobacter sp.]
MLSSLKNRLPALMLALYIFSFWILPQDWAEGNSIDGSWRYALGKFRELGLSLGSDSWFTYGPLAHWFGAPMGQQRFQPLPYYLLGLFIAGIIVRYLSRIFDAVDLSWRVRLISVILLPFSFIGMDGSHEVHLVIALFLLIVSCSLRKTADLTGIVLLIILSACGVLYKISFGIMSSFALFVLLTSLLVSKKIAARTFLLCISGYLATLYALFVVSSGSYHLFTYLTLGFETASRYSEVMIRHLPYSAPNYVIALVYLAGGSVLAWQASKKMAGRGAALCLIMAFLGAMLLLFKHGFVRADLSHMRLFYGSVTPVFAILALVSFTGFKTKGKGEKLLLCSASLLLLVLYLPMLKFLPGENNAANLARNWLTSGHRLVEGFKGQEPELFQAKRAFIGNSQPELFSRLNAIGRAFGAKGSKPRITFYPWELLLFEGVEGYQLAPSPSLQLYSTGPHSRAHRLEAEFLSSARRPDIVVIGPSAIDDRSPVAELTDLLPPLGSHYRVIDVVEGFTILRANEAGKPSGRVMRYTETAQGAPGELLRISFDQPQAVNGVLWRLAATLFKAPELDVVVTATHANGERSEYAWRCYLSQLQGGVLFAPQSLPELLLASLADGSTPNPSANPAAIKSAVAELRRSGGFWNLPVIPRRVSLKVDYVSLK